MITILFLVLFQVPGCKKRWAVADYGKFIHEMPLEFVRNKTNYSIQVGDCLNKAWHMS